MKTLKPTKTTPRINRAFGWTIGAASVAAGLAGIGALLMMRRPLPQTSGTTTLPGLGHRVQVLRDQWGVPHIYAETNHDLFAALGYVHAQDRLWQMELSRRIGHGQLAELLGPVALSTDRLVRVLGLSRIARREAALLDDDTRAIVQSYISGINHFLETHRHQRPLELMLLQHQPRPWELSDAIVWGKIIALNLSGSWAIKLLNARMVALVGEPRARELELRYPDEHPITVPEGLRYRDQMGAEALRIFAESLPLLPSTGGSEGSNAWVVGGSRSTSGAPLLANDPHLMLTLPSIWYEAHLEGGDYRVTGVSFPGVPAIIIGHNENIAWGLTNSMLDVQDLYIERFDQTNPRRYQWRDGWEEAEMVREKIAVRGQAKPVVEEVRITRHGPIISPLITQAEQALVWNTTHHRDNKHTEEALALRWAALEPGSLTRAILGLNRARNWNDFRTALAHWDAPVQNVVYADTAGHYGYVLAGRVPVRAQPDESQTPLPGWTGTHEWEGFIPAAALPAAYDPPEGFIVTANNRITGSPYQHHTSFPLRGHWLNGYRAQRIQQLLEATPHHDLQSFAAIQHDLLSLPGLELARLVARANLVLNDPVERAAHDMLVSWDGVLDAESVGGAVYTVLRHHLEQQAYIELDDLRGTTAGLGYFTLLPYNHHIERRALPNILRRIANAEGAEGRDPWLGGGRTWNSILQECLALTVAELRSRLGHKVQNWRYGRIHTLTLRHPLGTLRLLAPVFNRGPWPMGGDIDTVWMGYSPRDTAAGPMYTAPSYRQLCDTGDWDNSCSIITSGQSGHPASPHYRNMVEPWRTGTYHPMLWSRARVEAGTVTMLTLEPANAGVEHEKEACNK